MAAREASWKADARLEAELQLLSWRSQTHADQAADVHECRRSLARRSAALRKLPAQSLLVIYDDITLDLARPKLSLSGSAGGHNGISDLLDQVGAGFIRYRIGIGAKPHKAMDLADYVLSKFSVDEQQLLADRMPNYLDHLALVIDKGFETAMNTINQRNAS